MVEYTTWQLLEVLDDYRLLQCKNCGNRRLVESSKFNETIEECSHAKSNSLIDLTNQVFGQWRVLAYAGDKHWWCQCSCGEVKKVLGKTLRNGKSTSCGHSINTSVKHSNKRRIKLENTKINSWSILNYLGDQKYLCVCDCGNVRNVATYSLTSGASKSCGVCNIDKSKLDLSDQDIGFWHVIEKRPSGYYLCRCKCGTTKFVLGKYLRTGRSLSCGCMQVPNTIVTNLAKYDRANVNQRHMTKEQADMSLDRDKLVDSIHDAFGDTKPTPAQLTKLMGVQKSQVMIIIRKFKLEDLVNLYDSRSQYEDEINTLFPCSNRHDRIVLDGKELDLYYPESNLAIEFNGDYWHDARHKDINYHKNKSILAGKKRIQIIHIFEHEWKNQDTKRKLIDLINRKVDKLNIDRIQGRNCEIREISNSESVRFCDKYHLQNGINTQISLGCIYNNEIVGVMTFSRPRFNSEADFEIVRLCWKSGVTVLGGAEKLFQYFLRNYDPASIISYSDLSKFHGQIYLRLGFKFLEVTSPNYKWVNIDGDVKSRYQTQKHRLIEKGLGTPDQTENEIMENLGYFKIYDCGNMKFIWNKEQISKGEISCEI